MRGTLKCVIFGHKFIWVRLVETETSKQMRIAGLKSFDLPHDFIEEAYNTDTCKQCGLPKNEIGIEGNNH